jgi:predicted ABC-type ATPase
LARRIVSSPATKHPKLWIVAGPNGAGKSSLYELIDIETEDGSVWIINPDLLSARLAAIENLGARQANIEAVKRIENWLEASIQAHQTIGVETVLSTAKYRRLVTAAKRLQFEINFIYVLLAKPEMHVERVRLRVMKGGHDVPVEKILERRGRSLKQLSWFLQQADRAWLYDNSAAEPRLMGAKRDGVITLDPDALPEIKSAAERIKSN